MICENVSQGASQLSVVQIKQTHFEETCDCSNKCADPAARARY